MRIRDSSINDLKYIFLPGVDKIYGVPDLKMSAINRWGTATASKTVNTEFDRYEGHGTTTFHSFEI